MDFSAVRNIFYLFIPLFHHMTYEDHHIMSSGGVFSNSIKLLQERQKITLYQQEMLLEKAKVTLYQHAVRESKNHTLPAGYAPLEGYAAREAKIYTLPAGYAKISP